jgi:hypothetical protein
MQLDPIALSIPWPPSATTPKPLTLGADFTSPGPLLLPMCRHHPFPFCPSAPRPTQTLIYSLYAIAFEALQWSKPLLIGDKAFKIQFPLTQPYCLTTPYPKLPIPASPLHCDGLPVPQRCFLLHPGLWACFSLIPEHFGSCLPLFYPSLSPQLAVTYTKAVWDTLFCLLMISSYKILESSIYSSTVSLDHVGRSDSVHSHDCIPRPLMVSPAHNRY